MVLKPALVDFRTQGADEAEAAGGVGKDPDDPCPSLDLLVESFKHVGRLQMLVVLARQAVEAQRLADVRFDPSGELRIAGSPAREPRLQILLGLLEVAAVVEPAQRRCVD